MVKSAIGVAIALVVLAAATGCGADGAGGAEDGEERPAPRPSPSEWVPETELPGGVRVVARGTPRNAGTETAYDYEGAAHGVLELQAELARMEFARGGPDAALEWTVPDSPAADEVREYADAAADSGTVPVGTYVLRDFEVSGYAADLLQIDVCLDKRDVRLRPVGGGPKEKRSDVNEDVWWAGYTMRPGDGGTWRAEEIQSTPVGADRSHRCAG